MCVYEHMDGSVQLIDGRKIHMDELRSDRVFVLKNIPSRSDVARWGKGIMADIFGYMPLAKLVDDIPLQALPIA